MRKFLRGTFWTLLALGVIAGVLRFTILDAWSIPDDDPARSLSLAPSLWPGDLVLLYRGTSSFGDLVRCTDPENPGRFVVGRILGDAGDRVEIFGTDVAVNDKRGVQEATCPVAHFQVQNPNSEIADELNCSVEAIGGRKHKRASKPGRESMTPKRSTVGEGQVFLVSDNRVYPFDSRDYGTLPLSSCPDLIFFRVMGDKGIGDVTGRFTFVQ